LINQTYKIAHLREQGQDMIIIPVTSSVGSKNQHQLNEIKNTLQTFASNAGLAGTVCLVWSTGNKFNFLAPTQWHNFFRSIDMIFVSNNFNKKLMCYND